MRNKKAGASQQRLLLKSTIYKNIYISKFEKNKYRNISKIYIIIMFVIQK